MDDKTLNFALRETNVLSHSHARTPVLKRPYLHNC